MCAAWTAWPQPEVVRAIVLWDCPCVLRRLLAAGRHRVLVRERAHDLRQSSVNSADPPLSFVLRHLLKGEGGAAEWMSRRRLL